MAAIAVTTRVAAQTVPTTRPPACQSAPEFRQMDFWAGTWDTAPWTSAPGTKVGSNTVLPLLDGCLLLENYSDPTSEGKSFNYYDPNTRQWRQVWVDRSGAVSDVSGEFKDGALRLSGRGFGPTGARVVRRMTLTPVSSDVVHQVWEQSTDEGKTWTVVVDVRYSRAQ